MKLVISVDNYKIEACKRRKEEGQNAWYHDMVLNGKPLEQEIVKELKKIRTKIDALPTMSCNSVGCSYMWAKDYKIDVLSILDKSIEENKE